MDQGTEADIDIDTTASFTGKLLRCEYTPDKKFVQLVFHEGDRDVLCVSTSRRAAELPIGRSYHVEGIFKQHGDQGFIYNPKVVLSKKQGLHVGRLAFVVVVFVGVAGFGGMTYVAKKSPTTPAPVQSVQSPADTKTDTAQATPAAAAVSPSSTTPTSTPAVTKQTTKTTTTNATTPVVSSTPPPPATPSNVAAVPSTPTDVMAVLTATDTNYPDGITVSWGASTDTGNPGLGGYIVFQNNIENDTDIEVATVDANTTSFVDDTPVTGQYSYTVEAFDTTNPADVSAMSDASPVVDTP